MGDCPERFFVESSREPYWPNAFERLAVNERVVVRLPAKVAPRHHLVRALDDRAYRAAAKPAALRAHVKRDATVGQARGNFAQQDEDVCSDSVHWPVRTEHGHVVVRLVDVADAGEHRSTEGRPINNEVEKLSRNPVA